MVKVTWGKLARFRVGPLNAWLFILCIFAASLLADLTTGNRELEVLERTIGLVGENRAWIFDLRSELGTLRAQIAAQDSTQARLEAKVDSLRVELYWAQKEWYGQ